MSTIDLVHKQLIRNYPVRPIYVTKALLSLTRHYFARPEYLVTPLFRTRHNQSAVPSPDDFVVIESPMAWPVEYTDKRPAVFIRRLKWNTLRLGLGDGRQSGSNEILSMSRYTWAWAGSHAFVAISREGGELELLVEELINLLLRYTSVIRELFGFSRFQLATVGTQQAYITATDVFQVPITVQYEWLESFQLQPTLDDFRAIIENTISELEG